MAENLIEKSSLDGNEKIYIHGSNINGERYFVKSSTLSNNTNQNILEYTTENGYDLLKQIDNYDANFLIGSPTVNLDNQSSEMLNDHNRFIYWDKLRSHFSAGRHNNVNDIIPQWLVGKLAQYTAVFGWGNFAYGGKNFVNGSQNKAQFISGYENRGGATYAQTQGAFNANFGVGSIVEGTENYLGSTLYSFTYDKPSKTFTINGDYTAFFALGDLLGIRVLNVVNNYYTVATGVITSITLSGGNTLITTGIENWIDQNFTTGMLFNAEISSGNRNSSVSGNANVVQNANYSTIIGRNNYINQLNNSYITGQNNVVNNLTNIKIVGDNITPLNSYGYYESNSDSHIISRFHPIILDMGSLKRLIMHPTDDVFFRIPNNVLWQVGLNGFLKNETLNTYHEVNGSALISKDTSANVLTQSTTVSGGGTYNFNFAIYQSGNSLVIEFPNNDILKGAFEVVIKQINL